MQRWLIHLTIVAYLSALFYGIASYAVSYRVTNHPSTYFVVWDMFCGWSAYSNRLQIIGQGESGKFYRLDPPPWGEYLPFGELGRRHYDTFGFHAPRLAMNTLKQTRHEPISQIYVIEESWPKKFNLPDHVWYRRYEEPKDVHKYYNIRNMLDGEGNSIHKSMPWITYQSNLCISDNPRLQSDSHRGRPFYAIDIKQRTNDSYPPMGIDNPAANQPAASLLGGN